MPVTVMTAAEPAAVTLLSMSMMTGRLLERAEDCAELGRR